MQEIIFEFKFYVFLFEMINMSQVLTFSDKIGNMYLT